MFNTQIRPINKITFPFNGLFSIKWKKPSLLLKNYPEKLNLPLHGNDLPYGFTFKSSFNPEQTINNLTFAFNKLNIKFEFDFSKFQYYCNVNIRSNIMQLVILNGSILNQYIQSENVEFNIFLYKNKNNIVMIKMCQIKGSRPKGFDLARYIAKTAKFNDIESVIL